MLICKECGGDKVVCKGGVCACEQCNAIYKRATIWDIIKVILIGSIMIIPIAILFALIVKNYV